MEGKGHHCQIYIVLGLAGSGKTTLTARFKDGATKQGKSVYVINLDPVTEGLMPYAVNLDIRDTVNYRKIMEDRKMGPNGAIMLALNMFLTKIDQLSRLLEGKIITHDYIVIDTPGQIEMFTWSAAGDLICKILKELVSGSSAVDLSMLYLVDNSKRSHRAFMAGNLLHACGIKYRMDIPLEVVVTKCDLKNEKFNNDNDDGDDFATTLHQDIEYVFSPLFERFRVHYVTDSPYETIPSKK